MMLLLLNPMHDDALVDIYGTLLVYNRDLFQLKGFRRPIESSAASSIHSIPNDIRWEIPLREFLISIKQNHESIVI